MRRAGFFFGVLVLSIIVSTGNGIVSSANVSAKTFEPDWLTMEPTYKELQNYQPDPECVKERWTIEINLNYDYLEDPLVPMEVCVYHGKDFAIAWYAREARYKGMPYAQVLTESGWAIVVDGVDFALGRMYPLASLGGGKESLPWVPLGGATNAVYIPVTFKTYFGEDIYYLSDVTAHIQSVLFSDGYARRYLPKSDFFSRKLNSDYLDNLAVFGTAHSRDGKFFVIASLGALVVYDTTTNQARMIGRGVYYDTSAWPGQSIEMAVSDDGRYLAFSGRNQPFYIVKIINSCGILNYTEKKRALPIPPCPVSQLSAFTRERSKPFSDFSGGVRWYSRLAFSRDADSLSYYDEQKWSVLVAGNMQYAPKMQYLALGDSFASGEGDITVDKSHYLPRTNEPGAYIHGTPREMCHLSDRSYPFLFANDMSLARGVDMQSIACSGAVRNDLLSSGKAPDYLDPAYRGQATQLPWIGNGPRLQHLENAEALQNQARDNFTPGRVQQIEHVKKYHPRVATVMVSGNDLGFGDVVTACLMNLPPGKSCSYVDGDGRKRMAAAIRTNYEEQVRFYQALKAVSPYTKFYAVGYPQFISDKGLLCWDSGGLGKKEREFIRESVSYVNQSIRSAAAAAGIRYIHIEDALEGIQMCGSGDGVSGTIDRVASSLLTEYAHRAEVLSNDKLPLYSRWLAMEFQSAVRRAKAGGDAIENPSGMIMGYVQELFHPNSVGHRAIRDFVAAHYGGASLLDAQCDQRVIICPVQANAGAPRIPYYFNPGNDVTLQDKAVSNVRIIGESAKEVGVSLGSSSIAILKQGARITIVAPVSAGRSALSAFVHSDPVALGELRADDASIEVTIPSNLPIGFHTITLTGTLNDGREIEYVQYVFVEGATGDVDGDGIVDSVDPCLFMKPGGVDADLDGIDDDCDLDVDPKAKSAIGASIEVDPAIKLDAQLVNTELSAGTDRRSMPTTIASETRYANDPTGSIVPDGVASKSIEVSAPNPALAPSSELDIDPRQFNWLSVLVGILLFTVSGVIMRYYYISRRKKS